MILKYKDKTCEGRIVDNHTNIVYLKKNDEILMNQSLNNDKNKLLNKLSRLYDDKLNGEISSFAYT